ncbi:MAG: sodium:solute symporter family transporter [Gemmataceae bacterium]
MANLSWLDWVFFIGYLGIVFAIGWWFARQQQSNDDYFLGGRRLNWLPVGLSLFATSFSSLSFVGLPREAAYADYHLLLAILFIPLVVTPIVCIWFIPLYHRLGLTSAYEYLEKRFSREIRLLASTLYIVHHIGWMGSVLFAVAVILQVVLGLDETGMRRLLVAVGVFATFYTAIGGVKAVIWTDVLQAVALGSSMTAVLWLTTARVAGGWLGVWDLAQAHDKMRMFDFQFDLTQRGNFFAACAFGFFVYLAAHTVSLTAVQRYVSVPTVTAARWSLVVNGVMVAVVCGLFFLVGTAVFAFYHQPAATGFPTVARQDQLLPYFILTELPGFGLTGLLVAGLFAAAMSSLDSGLNTLTMSVVCDWLDDRCLGVGLSRALCVLFGAATIAAALAVPVLGETVFDVIIKISGTFFGLLLGVFLLGMLIPGAGTTAVWVGVAAGILSLFGVWTLTSVSHWWYGAVSCLPTFLAGGGYALWRPRNWIARRNAW